MKVELLAHTPNPEKLISMAAKLCYSSSTIDDIGEGLTDEKIKSFLNMLMDIGHESPLEHVSFTFAIEGISRACSLQLVRHRIASYSQKSQRYVNETQFEYVIPEAIANDPVSKDVYEETMALLQGRYDFIRSGLINNYVKNGMDEKAAEKKANEDARMILPNACETSIIVTMNIRSLFNFFKHRCCNRAQWEIREMATLMYAECLKVCPNIFKHAGPSCYTTGRCPEGKMTCGKMKEMSDKFANKHNIVSQELNEVHIPNQVLSKFKNTFDEDGSQIIVYVDGENAQYAKMLSDRSITNLGMPGPEIVKIDRDKCTATDVLGTEYMCIFVVHLGDIPPVDYDGTGGVHNFY